VSGRAGGAAVAVAAAVVAAALGGGCRKKAEIGGIGPYHVDRTTLASATGRCEPTDLPDGRQGTWCYGQPALRVADQNAQVDLYFPGTDPAAKVIEIQLQIRGCKEEPLAGWLRKAFGQPSEELSTKTIWKNDKVYVVGELPSSPGRCLVRVLPRSEEAELQRIRAQGQ